MRPSSPLLAIALLATFLTGGVAAARELRPHHLRGLNAEGRDLIASAAARSAIVRNQVDTLEATDVVVYVTIEPLPGFRRSGYLSFLSHAHGIRYLAVRLDSSTSSRESIAMLAHELQHALEVAASPEVSDGRTLARLYDRIGWRAGTGSWETDMARSVGERVRLELAGFVRGAPPSADPRRP